MQIPALKKNAIPTAQTGPAAALPGADKLPPTTPAQQRPNEDRLTLSASAQKELEELQNNQQGEEKYQVKRHQRQPPAPTFDPKQLREQAEAAQKQGEAMAKEIDTLTKCLVIAMRMMSGNRVTMEDEKFLSDNNAELYLRAILLRQKKEDPEEYDSITGDEESTEEGDTSASEQLAREAGPSGVESEGSSTDGDPSAGGENTAEG